MESNKCSLIVSEINLTPNEKIRVILCDPILLRERKRLNLHFSLLKPLVFMPQTFRAGVDGDLQKQWPDMARLLLLCSNYRQQTNDPRTVTET